MLQNLLARLTRVESNIKVAGRKVTDNFLPHADYSAETILGLAMDADKMTQTAHKIS